MPIVAEARLEARRALGLQQARLGRMMQRQQRRRTQPRRDIGEAQHERHARQRGGHDEAACRPQ